MIKIAPSILSADFLDLGGAVRFLNESADLVHLDVMDGVFVPNISFGFPVAEAVCKASHIPVDAHLMVTKPSDWFERFAKCGVSALSFHYEACPRSVSANLEKIKALGMKAGLAINPDIPVSKLYPFIGKADYFVIMSVFAGFGGQKFIYESLDKVVNLKEKLQEVGADSPIEVDGGVNLGNARALEDAGADILVAGSAVFCSEKPAEVIQELRGISSLI